jgi:alanine dehydrogenase
MWFKLKGKVSLTEKNILFCFLNLFQRCENISWVKDYNTKSHFYNTIQNHVHTIAIITQNFFEH